jgi:hypothetical protein
MGDIFFNLPAIPSDRDYQLWYITNDQRKVSARVFRDEANGRVELRILLPARHNHNARSSCRNPRTPWWLSATDRTTCSEGRNLISLHL